MNKEQLISEIKKVEDLYYQECNNNGGLEGTTLSYGLLMQLTILIDLLGEYFYEEYWYDRRIFAT